MGNNKIAGTSARAKDSASRTRRNRGNLRNMDDETKHPRAVSQRGAWVVA
jgi:hypothetical protein